MTNTAYIGIGALAFIGGTFYLLNSVDQSASKFAARQKLLERRQNLGFITRVDR